jgi:hypothetical protein
MDIRGRERARTLLSGRKSPAFGLSPGVFAGKEREMNDVKNRSEGTEAFCACSFCKRVPVSHLSLDIPEPITGWAAYFAARNITVLPDAAGRPSVARRVVADLIDEQGEREARLAEQAAQKVVASQPVQPAGVPALEGNSPYESMMAAGGVSPAEEFGRPRPDFLGDELAAGRRHVAEQAEAVRRAKDKLGGKDK